MSDFPLQPREHQSAALVASALLPGHKHDSWVTGIPRTIGECTKPLWLLLNTPHKDTQGAVRKVEAILELQASSSPHPDLQVKDGVLPPTANGHAMH